MDFSDMEVLQVFSDKKQFLDLLLLGDEQESMIDRYLEAGDMFVLYDGDLKSACVVAKNKERIFEIKNIATYEIFQGKGYGEYLVRFILDHYRGRGDIMYVGTGDVLKVRSFYEKCGFEYSHRVRNFFTDNYDHPIYESGVLLRDMIYFKKELN